MGFFVSSTTDKKKKRTGFFTSSDESGNDIGSVQNQIANAEARIRDSGYVKADSDKRNGFEKWANLPEGQNAFFDTLELLGRPGSAIKNVVDKSYLDGSQNVGDAAWRGFSGKDRVSGADLAERTGLDKELGKAFGNDKVGKFVGGLAIDIGTDPLTYVPGGALKNVAVKGGKLTAKALKPLYNGLEKVTPGLKAFRETKLQPAGESFKDGLGYMFNRNYKIDETLNGGSSDFLKNLDQSTDNSRRFMQEDTLGNLGKAARDAGGIQSGEQVGRILEAPLKVTLDADKTINDIMKGRPVEVNKVAGDLPDLVTKINDKVLNSPAVKRQIDRKSEQLKNIEAKMNKLENSTSDNAWDKIDELESAHERVASDLARIKKGIEFKPSDSADSFRIANPKRALYNRALGDRAKFLDDISPKGTYDKVVKPEHGEALKPIVTKLLQEGSVNVPKLLKGTPEQRELKRLFGDTLQTSYNKRSTTFKLNQKDPDAMYFNLVGAKPVIPERLTDAQKAYDGTGLQMDDVQFTDRIRKLEVPRPERELSADPKIQEAAQKLMNSNATIRQFAEQNGIAISELEGYMTHVWTQEERARRIRVSPVDRGAMGTGNPNKSLLKTRELAGSAEDVNERIGRKFFEPNAFYASAIGQKRLIDYVHAVKFRREVLSNPDFAKPFNKGMDVPKGTDVIDTNNYKFLKNSGDPLEGLQLADEVGGQYLVTRQAKMLLDRYQQLTTDEGTKAFLKAYDGIQSFWKRFALFSLGYHARNQAGAMFNNYVGGMNPVDLANYTQQGFREVAKAIGGKESALFNEYRRQGLSSTALSQVEFAKYGEEPEQAIERTVKNLSKDGTGQVLQRVNPLNAFQTSQEVGNFFDQANRFSLYKWAREKKKMTPEQAAAKVREVQFDYTKLTGFEQNVVARVIPFYRWMKNNIPFQIRQFINDPRKYEYLNKARINAQEAVGLDDENIPSYMKESFSIPITGGNGKGKMLGLNLPLGDLTKLSRPGKMLVDSFTPLLKTPAELALNYNMFRGKKIQEFAGQEKKYDVFGAEFGLPIKTAYGLEQATGQIGRGVSGFFTKPESINQDNVNRLPSLGISSLTKDFDADKYAYYAQLDELRQMQDLMLFIEQQTGEKPRTVREIKKSSSSFFQK